MKNLKTTTAMLIATMIFSNTQSLMGYADELVDTKNNRVEENQEKVIDANINKYDLTEIEQRKEELTAKDNKYYEIEKEQIQDKKIQSDIAEKTQKKYSI